MSQLCGPGSSPFTGPITTGPSVSMSAVNAVFTQAGQLFSAITTRVLNWVQAQLEAASITAGGLSAKIAVPIVAGLNQAEATAAAIGTVVQASITGKMAAATGATAAGGTAEQGVQRWQFTYNVFQDIDAPASVFIYNSAFQPASIPTTLCFRGGWDDITDALAYKSTIQGTPVPAGCLLPGGIAGPPPPAGAACPAPGWYNVYYNLQNGKPFDCVLACASDPPPPGLANFQGPFTSQDSAQAWIDANCPKPPPPPPPPPTLDWYAGCNTAGLAVSWETVANQPAGVTGVVGPFADSATALASLTTCVPPPPPPPPPPPTPGVCCDPVTGKVMLPDCITLDLCDWSKFEDALVNALCRWYEKCVCKLDNETAYTFNDCDGTLTTAEETWFGAVGKGVLDAASIDDMAKNGVAPLAQIGSGPVTSSDPWTRPPR